jgi:hypothetical protein
MIRKAKHVMAGYLSRHTGLQHCLLFLLVAASLPLSFCLAAEETGDPQEKSLTREMYRQMQLGNLNVHGDEAAVEALVLQLNIPITYDYIATLLRTPNAFGQGPACIVCHSSNDPQRSYRGLDLSTCEGILRGATEAPARPLIVPGKPERSLLVKKLRDNRMPLGVSFLHPTDTENILRVKAWIDGGAKNDEQFSKDIMPLFQTADAFGTENPCISCHSSFRDPPSFNEVNLTSHEAIMKGAWSRTNGKQGRPGVPIVVPYDAASSPLYQRLTENRMPPGMDPGKSSNHPNVKLLMRWIEQGAW